MLNLTLTAGRSVEGSVCSELRPPLQTTPPSVCPGPHEYTISDGGTDQHTGSRLFLNGSDCHKILSPISLLSIGLTTPLSHCLLPLELGLSRRPLPPPSHFRVSAAAQSPLHFLESSSPPHLATFYESRTLPGCVGSANWMGILSLLQQVRAPGKPARNLPPDHQQRKPAQTDRDLLAMAHPSFSVLPTEDYHRRPWLLLSDTQRPRVSTICLAPSRQVDRLRLEWLTLLGLASWNSRPALPYCSFPGFHCLCPPSRLVTVISLLGQ